MAKIYIDRAAKARFVHLLHAHLSEHSEQATREILEAYVRPIVHGVQHRFQFRLADEEQILHDAEIHILMRLDMVSTRKNWFSYLTTAAMNYLREIWSMQARDVERKGRYLEHLISERDRRRVRRTIPARSEE